MIIVKLEDLKKMGKEQLAEFSYIIQNYNDCIIIILAMSGDMISLPLHKVLAQDTTGKIDIREINFGSRQTSDFWLVYYGKLLSQENFDNAVIIDSAISEDGAEAINSIFPKAIIYAELPNIKELTELGAFEANLHSMNSHVSPSCNSPADDLTEQEMIDGWAEIQDESEFTEAFPTYEAMDANAERFYESAYGEFGTGEILNYSNKNNTALKVNEMSANDEYPSYSEYESSNESCYRQDEYDGYEPNFEKLPSYVDNGNLNRDPEGIAQPGSNEESYIHVGLFQNSEHTEYPTPEHEDLSIGNEANAENDIVFDNTTPDDDEDTSELAEIIEGICSDDPYHDYIMSHIKEISEALKNSSDPEMTFGTILDLNLGAYSKGVLDLLAPYYYELKEIA